MATCSVDGNFTRVLYYALKQLGRLDLSFSIEQLLLLKLYIHIYATNQLLVYFCNRLLKRHIWNWQIYEVRPSSLEMETSSRAVIHETLSFGILVVLNKSIALFVCTNSLHKRQTWSFEAMLKLLYTSKNKIMYQIITKCVCFTSTTADMNYKYLYYNWVQRNGK